MSQLTFALAKGRLLEPSIRLLEALGYDLGDARDSRKLVITSNGSRFLIAKASDVPVYVEYGAADVGIVGQDALRESGVNVYEPMMLSYGACRLVVAGKPVLRNDATSRGENNLAVHSNLPRAIALKSEWKMLAGLRVATKYPRCAQKYFSARGLSAEIITLYGSIELAPMVGLAELIVDVVDTGRTLRENGLVELDEIFKSQATFIVNRAAHTLRGNEIQKVIDAIAFHNSSN